MPQDIDGEIENNPLDMTSKYSKEYPEYSDYIVLAQFLIVVIELMIFRK